MSPSFRAVDPEALRRARDYVERPLSLEEFEAHLASELSEEERAEKRSLLDWFMRRYPSPAERLAYARRYALSVHRALRPR